MTEIKPRMKISSIAAISENHVIGKDGGMPWHIPADLKHFKTTTMNHPLIMGRKSFESLPGVLKGRTHIVISRQGFTHPEAISTASLEDALERGKEIAQRDGQNEIFVTGGGEIYKQALPLMDRLYITLIHRDYDGDTFFPEFDWDEWETIVEDRHEGSSDEDPAFTIFTLERK